MPRNRSIIFDGALGRVFANTANSVTAAADKLIAGAVGRTTALRPRSTTTLVASAANLGGGVARINITGGLLTNITCTLTRAPALTPVAVAVKVGTTYATATTIATITIPVNSTSGSATVTRTLTGSDGFFADVSAAGTSANRATGLTITATYYPS